MRDLKPLLAAGLLLMACDETPGGAGSGSDGGGAITDGASSTSGDGGGTGSDGGDPLMDPLSEFCTGEGTVVQVGASNDCAGEIAEDTFQFGVCACETVSIGSRLTVDAFDSREGGYGDPLAGGGVNIVDDGHVGANQSLLTDGKLEVRGGVFVASGGFRVGSQSSVSRNLYVVGDATQEMSSSAVGRNAFVNGDVVGRYQIAGDLTVPSGAQVDPATEGQVGGQLNRQTIPAIDVCPCEADDLLDVAALTRWARDNNDNAATGVLTSTTWSMRDGPHELRLPCGRYYLTNIDHEGRLTIIAEGRTVLFVDGDMIVEGGLTLGIEDGAEIDLFVVGNLSTQASARFGNEDAPSKVRTYVGGTERIDLGASTVFGGNLYAPRAEIDFGASAELFGAVFGRLIRFSGSASVHFDRAIRSAGDDCDEPVDPDPTQELDGGPGDANPAPDAGPIPDAGPVPDAGEPPTVCMSCGECEAPQGCVIPEGATSGMCGACTRDVDCCAPMVCSNGACIFEL